MEIINKYKAIDGKLFDSQTACKKYETMANQIYKFLDTLPNTDKYNLSNGNGYIQHDSKVKAHIEKILLKLSNDWFKPEESFTGVNYYLGRLIDDSNITCLNTLMTKWMCIDINNREWDQPYYAINPDKGTQKQLN